MPLIKVNVRKIMKWLFYMAAILLFFIFLVNILVIGSTSEKIYTDIEKIPEKKVGLVLGTSHRLQNGDSNMFFFQRIDQTVLLYEKGKIQHIIVSGDNSSQYYNEPLKMKSSLMERGVPDSVITMDYAGFRTLDSVVRSKLVFGQDELIIITQDFHSYRALFIAEKHSIDAVASVGEPLPLYISFKVELREILARAVAVWDIYIINTAPKFLGKKEKINS